MGLYKKRFFRLLAGLLLVAALVAPGYSQPLEQPVTGSEAQTETGENPESDAGVPELLETALIFDRPLPIVDGLDPVFPDSPFSVPEPRDENDPDYLAQLDRINDQQNVINILELDGGAWNQGLQDQLAVLGRQYLEQGNFEQAVSAYQRAIQISRINNGLDSLDQVPLVHELINSHIAQGEWDEADQYQNYLFYVQNKLYGSDDPRMVPVMYDLARWNLRVFNHRFGESLGLRLTDTYALFKAATAIVSVHFGNDDERYVAYLKDMAGSAYLVSRNQSLIEDAGKPEYRSVQAMFSDRMSQIDPVNALGYREGEEALTRVIEHYASQDDATLPHAESLIGLGDWYMLFDRWGSAEEKYKEAYALLMTLADGPEQAAAMFGQVVPLPAFSGSVGELALRPEWLGDDPAAIRSGYADVSVDVNSFGQVAAVRVLTEENEENARIFTLLRRKVRATTFRPVMQDGEPQRTEDNRFRYRFWY